MVPQGAAQLGSATVNVSNSAFYGNFAGDEGGAVYMESVGVALQDVMMDGNSCAPQRGLGGALRSVLRAHSHNIRMYDRSDVARGVVYVKCFRVDANALPISEGA